MTNLIRLNEKGIRAYTASGGSARGPSVNWGDRIGKLVKFNRARSIAYVIWAGTRSFDRVSVELIERCGVGSTADQVAAITR
jgi:hypothetical protein